MSSEITYLRQQLQLQHEAADSGLSGLASGAAKHNFIEARATRGADHILQLIQEGKHKEAFFLMELPDWGEEGKPSLKYGQA
jgi:hypothetical protein